MSCILRVSGKALDPETVVAGELGPFVCRVFRKGEPRRPARPEKGVRSESGVNVTVSNADFGDFAGQTDDAIDFFRRHRTALRQLCSIDGVENLTLDFAVDRRDLFVQSERFPPELLEALASIGAWLEISIYPVGEGTDAPSVP
jgi:hypothetical protein